MTPSIKIYQFKISLKGIKPLIWRKLLIQNDKTLKDLHYVIQILMGWTNYHLNDFTIKGTKYTIPNQIGNTSGGGRYGSNIKLNELGLKKNQKILYEYDFTAGWEFDVRLEEVLIPQSKKLYPTCISGEGTSPEEECGGPEIFMELKDYWEGEARKIVVEYLMALYDEKNTGKMLREMLDRETIEEASYWLCIDKYEFKEINKFLKFYGKGDKRWIEAFYE